MTQSPSHVLEAFCLTLCAPRRIPYRRIGMPLDYHMRPQSLDYSPGCPSGWTDWPRSWKLPSKAGLVRPRRCTPGAGARLDTIWPRTRCHCLPETGYERRPSRKHPDRTPRRFQLRLRLGDACSATSLTVIGQPQFHKRRSTGMTKTSVRPTYVTAHEHGLHLTVSYLFYTLLDLRVLVPCPSPN